MKNKKGFTLVELLAVISILGMLLTIAVISVNKIIENSNNKAHQTLMDEVWEAYKKCMVEYPEDCPSNPREIVNLYILVDKGYLSSIVDPKTKEDISRETYLTYNNNKYCIYLGDQNGITFASSEYVMKG